jgi:hypothetical protein
MALESSLWKRIKAGAAALHGLGTRIDLKRLENAVAAGHPDVEGCIDGQQIWIELKSELRPARLATPIRFKVRPAQSIWHKQRGRAGSRHHWVLCQVGEAAPARLYLIPGWQYDKIVAPESDLEVLSACPPTATPADVLMRAVQGW